MTLSVNAYQEKVLTLNYANHDAVEITKKLKELGQKTFEKVHSYSLKDENMTRENILREFQTIAKSDPKPKIPLADYIISYQAVIHILNYSFINPTS